MSLSTLIHARVATQLELVKNQQSFKTVSFVKNPWLITRTEARRISRLPSEHIPQVLVINLVVILNLRHLHYGSQQTGAPVR